MATIDIRNEEKQVVTEIVFSDVELCASSIMQHPIGIFITNQHRSASSKIANKEDAENLILALKKAIELGWFE